MLTLLLSSQVAICIPQPAHGAVLGQGPVGKCCPGSCWWTLLQREGDTSPACLRGPSPGVMLCLVSPAFPFLELLPLQVPGSLWARAVSLCPPPEEEPVQLQPALSRLLC